ncbi:hypothetical protein K466DRAFT_500009, partial [Polyporus arcularius HHB13444]
ASDSAIASVLQLKGLETDVQDVDALVSLTCSPITSIRVGSGESCSDTKYSCRLAPLVTTVDIGCVPIPS